MNDAVKPVGLIGHLYVGFLPAIPARKAVGGQSVTAGVQEEYPDPGGAEGGFSRSYSHTSLPGPNGIEGTTKLGEWTLWKHL